MHSTNNGEVGRGWGNRRGKVEGDRSRVRWLGTGKEGSKRMVAESDGWGDKGRGVLEDNGGVSRVG